MKPFHLLLAFYLLISTTPVWAQIKAPGNKDSISINDLNIPTAPGLVLADKAPTSIEQPTNPKALSLSLLDLWQGGAIEFNPYWLNSHPAYKFEDYSKHQFPLLETIGISAATFKTDTSTAVSAGIRTQLIRIFSGKVRNSQAAYKDSIVGLLSNLNLDENAIDKYRDMILAIRAKPTFDIELAGAYLANANNSSYQDLTGSRWGVWFNIMWNPSKFPLTFVGLTRYLKTIGTGIKNKSDSAFFDYGLNLSYNSTVFNVSAEYVERSDLIYNTNYHRFTLAGNFQISSNIVIVASVGKNFSNVNNLITVFGAKFGLSKEKVNTSL